MDRADAFVADVLQPDGFDSISARVSASGLRFRCRWWWRSCGLCGAIGCEPCLFRHGFGPEAVRGLTRRFRPALGRALEFVLVLRIPHVSCRSVRTKPS